MDRNANNVVNVNRFLDLRIANGRFIVKQKLGSGSFGEIFSGIDTAKGNKDVAIKLEQVKTRHPQLAYESKIYKLLHANNSIAVPPGAAGTATNNQQPQQQQPPRVMSSPNNGSPAPQPINNYSDGQTNNGMGDGNNPQGQWSNPPQQGYGYGSNSGDYTTNQQQNQMNNQQQQQQYLPAVGTSANNGNSNNQFGASGNYSQQPPGASSSSGIGVNNPMQPQYNQQRRMSLGGDGMGNPTNQNPYGQQQQQGNPISGYSNAGGAMTPNVPNDSYGGSPSQMYPNGRLPPITGANRLPPLDVNSTGLAQQQYLNLQQHNQQQLMQAQSSQSQMPAGSNIAVVGSMATASNMFGGPASPSPMIGRRSSVSDPANQPGGNQYGSSNPLVSSNTTSTMMSSGGGTSIGASYTNYVIGVPDIYYFGVEGDYNVMVIDLCGPSLEDLFCYCGRKFSLKTIVLLADQLLHRIQFLHSKYLIHRDLKPENFVMGMRDKSHHVYLIDYGLSKRYWDGKTNQHIPYMEGKPLTGTARYCSVNTHLGIEQSRRDDLESIGYIILYFYKGSLPWQGIRAIEPSQKTVRIGEKKISIGVEYLCRDEPPPFMRYMKYCRGLKFEETPDYQWCRRLFTELGEKEGIRRDWVFDWVDKRQRERMLEESQSQNGSMADGVVGSSITGFTNNPHVNSKLSFYNNESSNNTVRANEMSHRSLI